MKTLDKMTEKKKLALLDKAYRTRPRSVWRMLRSRGIRGIFGQRQETLGKAKLAEKEGRK